MSSLVHHLNLNVLVLVRSIARTSNGFLFHTLLLNWVSSVFLCESLGSVAPGTSSEPQRVCAYASYTTSLESLSIPDSFSTLVRDAFLNGHVFGASHLVYHLILNVAVRMSFIGRC